MTVSFGLPIFLFFTCFTTLLLSNAEASLILNTNHQQRQSASDDDRDGLTFEKCGPSVQPECKHPRFCFSVSGDFELCLGVEACHCLPLDILPCSSHTHCVEGEVCAEVEEFGTVCASEAFVNEFAGAKKLPGEKPPPPPFPSEEGLTLDPCENGAASCAFPRFCFAIVNGDLCGDTVACHCRPNGEFIFCSSSRECVNGEICASVPDTGDICVSESFANHSSTVSAVPDPSPSPATAGEGSNAEGQAEPAQAGGQSSVGPICIGVEFLEHIPRDALRFKIDSIALVLCDENRSCATPGHMVQYNGEPMMMVSYCKFVNCKREMMKVNSPRYQRGMTIGSRTSGLQFTVFAARYGTLTEEIFLKAVLRLGL